MEKISTTENKEPAPLFSARWNLVEFRDLINEGLGYGCFHFFLIKNCGVRLLVRESDFLPSSEAISNSKQKVIHAIGLNRDIAIEDDNQYAKIREASNALCASDVCEWFSLSIELLNDVEERLSEDFTEIQFTFNKFEFNVNCFDEYSLAKLESGESVLTHNVDIDWYGGGCSATSMIAEIEISYIKDDEYRTLESEYGGNSLYINRSMAQSFKRFTAENFPNGFVDDAVDSTSVEHTSDKTQYDLLIKETPESRFTNITLEYLESLSENDSQSRATINLITYIAYGSDAECFVEGLEEGESLAEAIHSYVEWTTSIEGLNNFLDEQIDDAKQDDYLNEFGIDSTGALDYIDVESFLRDIDYNFVINAIKSCWNRVSNNHIK